MSQSAQDEREEEHEIEVGRPRWWLHALLFVAACVTAALAGMNFAEGNAFDLASWQNAEKAAPALGYMVCVMLIIFCHEMGHYLKALAARVPVSPPYFLPGLPIPGVGVLPLMGTFGAVIQMQLKPMRARTLLQIGAWGPLAGFLVTVPVLLIGYALSEVRPLPTPSAEEIDGVMTLGDSLLMWGIGKLFFPSVPEGHDIFLHPVAMAGWTGGFLTALNLLPLGQLDGGHVSYTVFGERYNRVAPLLLVGLVVLGVTMFTGWLLMAALVWKMGARHPRITQDEVVRGKEAWLAWASLGMFVLTFSPRPIVMPSLLQIALEWLGLTM